MIAEPIRFLDKLVFGADATRCPRSGIIWETGIGSATREIQTARALEAQPTFKAELDIVRKAEAEGFHQ
jgi:hypothetical protein